MATLERAILIAAEAHRGQKDKAGKPYILHPLRMMLLMESETEMIVAALHDVVEDTYWTIDDLKKEGFSEQILNAVDCLTQKENETYEEFIERIMRNPTARNVKLADLEDNLDMTRIAAPTAEDWERQKKYHRARLRLRDPGLEST